MMSLRRCRRPTRKSGSTMRTDVSIRTLNGTARFRQQSVWCLCCYTVKHPQFMACAAKLRRVNALCINSSPILSAEPWNYV